MVVYDDETNSTHIFNRTATEIYSLCNQVTIEDIEKIFITKYNIENLIGLRKDIQDTIQILLDKELILEDN